MTSYKRERVTRTSLEYTVQADSVWGVAWKDLYLVAMNALNEAESRGQRLCDDTIRIFPSDDSLVLRVDLKDERENAPIARSTD